MRKALALLLGAGSFLVPARGRAEPPAPPPAPPAGFDVRRDGVERGKVEPVEYDSKTVGAKRREFLLAQDEIKTAGKFDRSVLK